jgi:uncharacterized membrane protein
MALFRGQETHPRSILKAISWRTPGTLDSFAISWFMTDKVEVAGSIAEASPQVASYDLHERVWAASAWDGADPNGYIRRLQRVNTPAKR